MEHPNAKIEYRVREVTRYIVTRYDCPDENSTGRLETKGEFDNKKNAYDVAYALCRADHERLGWQLDDPRIKYPETDYLTVQT